MLNKFTIQEMYALSISHARMDKSLDHMAKTIIGDIEIINKKISHMSKHSIVKSDEDYEAIKIQYKKILKHSFNTAHVYLLGEFKFDEFYVPPELKMLSNKSSHTIFHDDLFWDTKVNWKDIFRNDNISYVIGGPGYGKSLFLHNLIINHSELAIMNASEFLPIFCDLKNYLIEGRKDRSMISFLQESMISRTALEQEEITSDFIKYHLDRGRCIILLDALDEVPKESRYEMHKTIISFLQNINSNNRICITSRARSFVPMKDIIVFDILPLDKNQVEKYVNKIISLGEFKDSDRNDFLKQAKNLIAKDFLNSFLVLSLLVNIYRAERELPENKLDLYAKCFEYIANKREREINKPRKQYNWDKINPLMKDYTFIKLAILCFPNNQEVDRKDVFNCLVDEYGRTTFPDIASCGNAVTEFLDFCAERTELFVPAQKEDGFKFFHRSFFEYFYSQYIYLEIQDVSLIYKQFLIFDVDSEVFELTVSAFKQRRYAKYVDIIDYLFCAVKNELSESVFSACNILTILITQVITESTYQEKYIDILTDNYDSVVHSLNSQEGIKNTDMIVGFCGSSVDFATRIVKTYIDSINHDLMVVISTLSLGFLEKMVIDYDFSKPIKAYEVFDYPSVFFFMRNNLRFLGFYTTILLRWGDALNQLNELVTMTNSNNWRKIKFVYDITKKQAKRCKKNFAIITKWDNPTKELFCIRLEKIIRILNSVPTHNEELKLKLKR